VNTLFGVVSLFRMLVKNPNEGALTNHEVLELMKERKNQRLQSKHPATGIDFQHRASIENKVWITIFHLL
jgi:hypothetical protein